MDWLIVRHAESLHNVNGSDCLNSELTSTGHMQAMITADWLDKNFKEISEFKPLVSPYFRTLQTAHYIQEATDIKPFGIDKNLREFHIDKNEIQLSGGGMFVAAESLLFDHFEWPNLMEMGFFFKNETFDEFFERLQLWISKLDPNGKYLVVSHGTPCRTLHTLLTCGDLEQVRQRYFKVMSQEEIDQKMKEGKIATSIKNCSLTLIRDGQEEWFSKIVYDPIE